MKYILFVGEMLLSTDDIKMRQVIWNKKSDYAILARTGFVQKPGKRGTVILMYWACYGDPENAPRRPRRRQTLAGGRGEERVTEERERRVGDWIFPALIITMGRREGQEHSRSTSYSYSYSCSSKMSSKNQGG